MVELDDRFWSKVQKTDSCWLWTSNVNDAGYATFSYHNTPTYAHRLAYEAIRGEIPARELDHLATCPKRCINPDHLRPTTRKQNSENLLGAHCDSKSGIRGVSWDKKKGKWRVTVGHYGKQYWGGYFSDLDIADSAARALRNKLFTHNTIDRAETL